MSKWSWWFVGWAIAGVILWVFSPAHADNLLPTEGTWSLGAKAGYGISLNSRGVEMAPAYLHIGYTLFKGKWWVMPTGSFEIGVEPFGSSYVSMDKPKGHGDGEAGVVLPIFTYSFDLGHGFSPYLIGGLGLMYKDLHGYNTGGPFSFMETLGFGLSYFLNDNMALNTEFRFRHMSNAGIYSDNFSVNNGLFLAGFSYYLPNK